MVESSFESRKQCLTCVNFLDSGRNIHSPNSTNELLLRVLPTWVGNRRRRLSRLSLSLSQQQRPKASPPSRPSNLRCSLGFLLAGGRTHPRTTRWEHVVCRNNKHRGVLMNQTNARRREFSNRARAPAYFQMFHPVPKSVFEKKGKC
jgi:hypothetical protein